MRWQHPRVELLIDPKHTETMERLYPPFHNYHGPSRYCYCFRSQQRGSLYGYRYILYLYICWLTISYFVYHFLFNLNFNIIISVIIFSCMKVWTFLFLISSSIIFLIFIGVSNIHVMQMQVVSSMFKLTKDQE